MDGSESDAGAGESSSSRQAPPQPPLLPIAAAATPPEDAPAAAVAEEEDEQVEKFYALLANIRAMRGMGAADDIGEGTGGGGAATRKRWRGGADAPWRPAFRLEDFEHEAASPTAPDAARRAKRTQADDGGQRGARPTVAPSPPAADVRRRTV